MDSLVSKRCAQVNRSAIRELLKLTKRPEIISFAGGIPHPQTFPTKSLAECAQKEITENYKNSLQYGTTEGVDEFRAQMLQWLSRFDLNAELEETITTTASQQAVELVAKTFFDPDDVIFCGLPTYLGAVQAFSVYQTESVGIPLEDDGMNLTVLEQKIQGARDRGKKMKLIYVIPDFQNPSGVTMSETKRKRLVKIAQRYNLLILEDTPYFGLRFAGTPNKPIRYYDEDNRVITAATLSKLLSPGMRLALLVASKDLIHEIVTMKQATDLCTPTLTQWIAASWLKSNDMDEHLAPIRDRYRGHRNAMLEALEEFMPQSDQIEWTKPQGGLFIWVRLPKSINSTQLFHKAIENKVAFVPGEHFFVNGEGQNTLRLSFSLTDPEEIREGIKRLSEVIKQELSLTSKTETV